jgi:Carboxypeptidase regulatory-like domain
VHSTLRQIVSLTSLALLAPAITAQWSPHWDPRPAQISGYVVRENNGKPIQGAIVMLSPPVIYGQLQTAITDSNGEYRFPRVLDGSYQIIASAKGFITLTHRPDSSQDSVFQRVDRSTTLHGIDFELVPTQSSEPN